MTGGAPLGGYLARLADAGARFAVEAEAVTGGQVDPAEHWREWHAAAKVAEAAARAIDPGSPAAARFADLADLADTVAGALEALADGVTR